MTDDLASGFLQSLAQAATDETLFKEQADAIKKAIGKAVTCEQVEQQLKVLHGFDYRVPDLALDIVHLVFELAGKGVLQSDSYLFKHYGLDVRSSTFPILKRLTYYKPEKAISQLWSCLNCGVPKVAKEADETLKKIADYDRDVLPHIGLTIQRELLTFLQTRPEEELIRNLVTVTAVCSEILSLETESTHFISADTLEFSRGALIPSEELRKLRAGTVALLERLYGIAQQATQKRSIMGALRSVARHPYGKSESPEGILMQIDAEVANLLSFYKGIITDADSETLQKVGHDLYWMHYHHSGEYGEENIKKIFSIRDSLYANEEQNIFNVLVGFEAVFPFEWGVEPAPEASVKAESDYRNEKIAEYVKGMSADNYAEWRKRILHYTKVESDDAATFMYFVPFLRAVSKQHPAFAQSLLRDCIEELGGFRAVLIEGLLDTDIAAATDILRKWLDSGIYLQSVCRVLSFSKTLPMTLYKELLAKAIARKDQVILILLIGALAERYNEEDNTIPLIISAVAELTTYKDARWVNEYWWRGKIDSIATFFSDSDVDVILGNLLYAPSIGTHEEWILAPIARKKTEKVMELLNARILRTDAVSEDDDEKYRAIPYRFYDKLSAALAAHLERVTEMATDWMSVGTPEQRRRIPDLLHAITDDGFEELGKVLVALYRKKAVGEDVLIEILQEYAGSLETEIVWKELVMASPDNESLKNDCIGHFFGTGTTSGFDGVAVAYSDRGHMFTRWQSDANEAVRRVGVEAAKVFEVAAKRERERVDEEKLLREYDFKSKN